MITLNWGLLLDCGFSWQSQKSRFFLNNLAILSLDFDARSFSMTYKSPQSYLFSFIESVDLERFQFQQLFKRLRESSELLRTVLQRLQESWRWFEKHRVCDYCTDHTYRSQLASLVRSAKEHNPFQAFEDTAPMAFIAGDY